MEYSSLTIAYGPQPEFSSLGTAVLFGSAPEAMRVKEHLKALSGGTSSEQTTLRKAFNMPTSFEKLLTRHRPVLEIVVYRLEPGTTTEAWQSAGQELEDWFKSRNIPRLTQIAYDPEESKVGVSLISWESVEQHTEAVSHPTFAACRDKASSVRAATLFKGHLEPAWA